jgi:hypothetical protein
MRDFGEKAVNFLQNLLLKSVFANFCLVQLCSTPIAMRVRPPGELRPEIALSLVRRRWESTGAIDSASSPPERG